MGVGMQRAARGGDGKPRGGRAAATLGGMGKSSSRSVGTVGADREPRGPSSLPLPPPMAPSATRVDCVRLGDAPPAAGSAPISSPSRIAFIMRCWAASLASRSEVSGELRSSARAPSRSRARSCARSCARSEPGLMCEAAAPGRGGGPGAGTGRGPAASTEGRSAGVELPPCAWRLAFWTAAHRITASSVSLSAGETGSTTDATGEGSDAEPRGARGPRAATPTWPDPKPSPSKAASAGSTAAESPAAASSSTADESPAAASSSTADESPAAASSSTADESPAAASSLSTPSRSSPAALTMAERAPRDAARPSASLRRSTARACALALALPRRVGDDIS